MNECMAIFAMPKGFCFIKNAEIEEFRKFLNLSYMFRDWITSYPISEKYFKLIYILQILQIAANLFVFFILGVMGKS